jgi:hypothetical protein
MARITFAGFVSDPKKVGEVVTITVTLPSGDTMHVAAATLEDKTYSVVQEFIAEGDYSAVANVETGLATSDSLLRCDKGTERALAPRALLLLVGLC